MNYHEVKSKRVSAYLLSGIYPLDDHHAVPNTGKSRVVKQKDSRATSIDHSTLMQSNTMPKPQRQKKTTVIRMQAHSTSPKERKKMLRISYIEVKGICCFANNYVFFQSHCTKHAGYIKSTGCILRLLLQSTHIRPNDHIDHVPESPIRIGLVVVEGSILAKLRAIADNVTGEPAEDRYGSKNALRNGGLGREGLGEWS